SMTLSKPDHALGSKVDTKALSISRGVLDSVTFDEFHLTVKGWAILEDGSPLPYLTPCIGSYPISTARLERIERPDVVRRFQGASLSCGFSISILLSDIPESLIYSEIKILGGREDRSIRFQISSSGSQWHEGLHVKYSSPFRGRDFL